MCPYINYIIEDRQIFIKNIKSISNIVPCKIERAVIFVYYKFLNVYAMLILSIRFYII